MKDGDLVVRNFQRQVQYKCLCELWYKIIGGKPYLPDWVYWREFGSISSN